MQSGIWRRKYAGDAQPGILPLILELIVWSICSSRVPRLWLAGGIPSGWRPPQLGCPSGTKIWPT